MKRKTPQEKKELSYAKDRRNIYGRNDKASRKLIPLRKAQANRSYRHKVNGVLALVIENGAEDSDSLETSARSIMGERWKKIPDQPLGEVTTRRLKRRETHAGNGKTARKKAAEFLKALEIRSWQDLNGRWIAEAIGSSGVVCFGDTKEAAFNACRSLARAVYLEKIGALTIMEVCDSHISVQIK